MFGSKRRHRVSNDYVEPDLPITPMLDMSFQLLAFFIMTFQPTKQEGQIAVALPKEEGGGEASAVSEAKPAELKVTARVTATTGGKIHTINVFRVPDKSEGLTSPMVEPIEILVLPAGEAATNNAAEEDTKAKQLRVGVKAYFEDLKKRYASAGNRPAKLTLELDDKLLEAYVVNLFDAGIRAGFTDIAPVPIDPKKR